MSAAIAELWQEASNDDISATPRIASALRAKKNVVALYFAQPPCETRTTKKHERIHPTPQLQENGADESMHPKARQGKIRETLPQTPVASV